jgi:tetratricopeptide (TPR) repeat protein
VNPIRQHFGDPENAITASFVFLFTLIVYTITLTPSTPFWDGGEFIATSYSLGVPHAPGTPLYVLIGRVFTLIPIASIAQRVNWMSALSSAITLVFVYLITVKVMRLIMPWEDKRQNRYLAYLGGIVAAFIAGFATTFWDSSIEAEVYAGSCALMTLVIWLALLWRERLDEGNEDGLLLVITYLVGLGVGIHLGVAVASWAAVLFVFLNRPYYLSRWDYLGWALVTLSLATGVHLGAFLVAPAVLLFTLIVWLTTGKLRRLALWSSGLFILGLSVQLYLIIRSNLHPMINEAAPETWTALWKDLIRDQYKPASLFQRKAPLWYQLDTMWLRYMWWNFTLNGEQLPDGLYHFRHFLRGLFQPPMILTIVGGVVHVSREKKSGLMLLALFMLLGPVMAFYLNFRQGEVRERDYFYMQNFMFMAIWTGVGAAWAVEWVREQFRNPSLARGAALTAAVLVLVMSLIPLKINWRAHDRRGFYIARDYAYNMLMGLDKNAIIFTNGDNDTFPLWYLQEVEKIRTDVRVVNLSLLNTDWYIKQLRDLEPKVPISFNDAQIEDLYPFRDKTGRIWLVKDIATYDILKTNKWRKPVFIAVTVPDLMGLDKNLSMEGLAYRVNEKEGTKIGLDVDRTLKNLNEVYRYDGLVLPSKTDPNQWVHDTLVYKDDNASRLTQNYAAAYTRVAIQLMEQSHYEEALNQMQRAIAISPDFTGGMVTYGVLLEQVGRLSEAEAFYRKQLATDPGDWQLLYRLGECLSRQADSLKVDAKNKKLEESIPFYEAAIQRAPANQYYPYQGLAGVYYQLNRYDKAANVLERWLVLHPDDTNVKAIYEELRQSLSGSTPPKTTDSSGVPPAPSGSQEK